MAQDGPRRPQGASKTAQAASKRLAAGDGLGNTRSVKNCLFCPTYRPAIFETVRSPWWRLARTPTGSAPISQGRYRRHRKRGASAIWGRNPYSEMRSPV
eukprot:1874461-Pyramimonas_sp.AAC.3